MCLYIESLRALIIWCFIMDKYNYARWLTVHIFELITMHVNHLEVYKNFKKGFFSFQKLNKEFSRMNLDQVHQQNNKVIKSTGGATDLANKRDDSSLIRWETCASDIARIITEFEESEGKPLAKNALLTKHDKDNDIFCKNFEFDIKTLSRGLPINPLCPES